jgi:ATP-binding cassette subfamily C (CFTR/MRP) protein 4
VASSNDDPKQYGGIQEEPIEVAETRSSGNISFTVYSSYYSAGGNVFIKTFLLFIYIFTQILITGEECWITFWYCLIHIFELTFL